MYFATHDYNKYNVGKQMYNIKIAERIYVTFYVFLY